MRWSNARAGLEAKRADAPVKFFRIDDVNRPVFSAHIDSGVKSTDEFCGRRSDSIESSGGRVKVWSSITAVEARR